jgi:hypothetical protein
VLGFRSWQGSGYRVRQVADIVGVTTDQAIEMVTIQPGLLFDTQVRWLSGLDFRVQGSGSWAETCACLQCKQPFKVQCTQNPGLARVLWLTRVFPLLSGVHGWHNVVAGVAVCTCLLRCAVLCSQDSQQLAS